MTNKIFQTKLNSEEKVKINEFSPFFPKPKIVFKPYVQNQQFLLPKNIDDFISPGHIARLVSEIIGGMNIQFITDTYLGGGTSSYEPRMMLKSWILAFINRIYSCRLVAKNLRENLAFIWISGNQTPDFHTLNNFRLRLKEDIKKIFKQIVLYGIKAGIIKGEDIFIDHTKNEANANKHKVVWKKQVEKQSAKIDVELDELFKHIDKINEEEEKIFGNKDLPEQERQTFDAEKVAEIVDKINQNVKKEKISREEGREQRKKAKRTLELLQRKENYATKKQILNGRNSYSKTDHDAVAMMMKDKLNIKPAYNEGIAVENGFVLNYVISDNCGDSVSFIPLMKGVIDNIEKVPENANSDGAYGNEENSSFLEEKGTNNFLKYNTFHKEKSKTWRDKKFRLQDFKYNNHKDEFLCKNNIKLKLIDIVKDETGTGYIKTLSKYKAEDGYCEKCPFRDKCTSGKARTVEVSWKAERLKKQARENLNSDKGKEMRKRRGNEVESVFGDQKMNGRKRRYHLRGKKKVNLEAGLYYIAHNIRKIQTFRKFNERFMKRNELKELDKNLMNNLGLKITF